MNDKNNTLGAKENIEKMYKSNYQLYFLCILVGALTGITVSFYRWGLAKMSFIREIIFSDMKHISVKFFIVWFVFIFIGVLVDYLYRKFPTTSGSGIPQVKAMLLAKMDYKKWLQEFFAKFFAGLMGIGAGLSLGREGPSVQLGSYIAYGVSKIFKRDMTDRNYLLTGGASAGLAGAFGAPLAGVMFSIEELYRFINGKLLVCIFLASIVSDFTGRRFFGIETAFDMNVTYSLELGAYLQFALYILLAVIVSFLGKLFTFCLLKSQDIFKNIKFNRLIKVSFVMSLSFFLCIFFPMVTGGGHSLIEKLTNIKFGIGFLVLIFIIKLLFTTISYSTGFAGGIFLPMLVLGAIVGKLFAEVISLFIDFPNIIEMHFIVLAMAAFFVAVVRAPITGSILILEMTGSFELLLALATVSAVAYLITEGLHLEPVYEILYQRMNKDEIEEKTDEHSLNEKTLITLTVMSESILEGKMISQILWPEDVLVVSLIRAGVEKIPKGRTVMMAGDGLVLLLPKNRVAAVKEQLLENSMS